MKKIFLILKGGDMDIEDVKKLKIGDKVMTGEIGFEKTYQVIGRSDDFLALGLEYIAGISGGHKEMKIIKFADGGFANLKLKGA